MHTILGDKVEGGSQAGGSVKTRRIHSLDAYRGVLMILGIVLHGAIPFMHRGDGVSTDIVKFSFWSVHLFRMPAFFVLAGFFGALLWQRYGSGGMLMNRFERLALPLVLSLTVAIFVILYPVFLIERWYNHSGNIVVDALHYTLKEIIPVSPPGHLWFLYYLVVITFGVAWWVRTQEKRGKNWQQFGSWIRNTFEHPWRFVAIFALLHVVILLSALLIEPMGRVNIPVDPSWQLQPAKLAYYTLFYGLGWILFTSKTDLAKTADSAWKLTVLGLGCVLIHTLCIDAYNANAFKTNEPDIERFLVFLGLLVNWSVALFALSRGFMGLFYRYIRHESYVWRYVSDASYWIYLIHLVFALHLHEFSRLFNLPHLLDFGLTIVMTSLIGFVSYDLFVRSSFIGRFLNGRRYRRYGWRLSVPGLGLIALFFGCNLLYGLPYLETERRWIERGESLSQVPFDLKDRFEKTMTIDGHPKCKMLGRYAFCEISAKFKAAQRYCATMGGRLPIFPDKTDSEGVGLASHGLHVGGGWLGITDAEAEGTWLDDSGQPITFTHWDSAEPNDFGGGEDCAVFTETGKWVDVGCDDERYFVCQFETSQRSVDDELCSELTKRLESWHEQHGSAVTTSPLVRSIRAQCNKSQSETTTQAPHGNPIDALSGVWVPDLERIWQAPEFEFMAGHHKRWARGYRKLAQFSMVFSDKEASLNFKRKDRNQLIAVPYTIQSHDGDNIVLRAGKKGEEKTYSVTVNEHGLHISGKDVFWAVTRAPQSQSP